MQTANEATAEPVTALVRREWRRFRSRGRLIAMTAATLIVILLGVAFAFIPSSSCSEGPVEVACPTSRVGPGGQTVSDSFYFVHQPLGPNGTITVRLASMTGIITYPPPDHDEIVPGLVPWAKAGLIVKDGIAQGSTYAALMVTGSHGVRMQYDYTHDVAGHPGGVSAESPRWLRLTRSGDTITGDESTDGTRWSKVGTAHLPGLPATVKVGLFATSPGDLTLKRVALGASLPESRFTQVTAVFDNISLDGAPAAGWSAEPVGEMGRTDWERYHRAPGLVRSMGTFTVTGTGDIGPAAEGGFTVGSTLIGLAIGLIIVIVVAVRFATAGRRPQADVAAVSGRILTAKAIVIGTVAFLSGLIAAGVVMPVGSAILRANGISVLAVPARTELGVVVGVAGLFAVASVFALALGTLVRRTWVATTVAISAVVLPDILGTLPLLPDEVAQWLLRLTPAAAFAVQQTIDEYPQVTAHYVPSGGYFPLSGWAGFAVLCAYATLVLGLARFSAHRRSTALQPQAQRS
ncbi:hypothetical protein GCM10009609_29760 [Pseudonocardia aurantiaca]|uniref:DUF1349 domain-containing protein n=1 Tax=Pseudonocardia aurantiaca TaxID=75290 RepID=A0ABW4FI39_9PSEU